MKPFTYQGYQVRVFKAGFASWGAHMVGTKDQYWLGRTALTRRRARADARRLIDLIVADAEA